MGYFRASRASVGPSLCNRCSMLACCWDSKDVMMMMRRVLVLACYVMAGVYPAHADAIDGQWCLGSSHFEISGPNIRTPGGSQITGNYDRHGFTYVVPASEDGAGTQIVMVLLNEETVRVAGGGWRPGTWKGGK